MRIVETSRMPFDQASLTVSVLPDRVALPFALKPSELPALAFQVPSPRGLNVVQPETRRRRAQFAVHCQVPAGSRAGAAAAGARVVAPGSVGAGAGAAAMAAQVPALAPFNSPSAASDPSAVRASPEPEAAR